MNEKLASAKNFVKRHKIAIAVGTVAATVIVLQHQGIKSLNEFLEEHDLLETYYFIEE